jgi:hypothetical protein
LLSVVWLCPSTRNSFSRDFYKQSCCWVSLTIRKMRI